LKLTRREQEPGANTRLLKGFQENKKLQQKADLIPWCVHAALQPISSFSHHPPDTYITTAYTPDHAL
jgi:hypothetical protein